MTATLTRPDWRAERARVASLTRSRRADDPDLIEARRRMRVGYLADNLRRALAQQPLLTRDDRRVLAAIALGEEVAADVVAA